MILGTIRSESVPIEKQAKGNNPNYDFTVPSSDLPGIFQCDKNTLIKQGKDTSNLHLIMDTSRIGCNLFSNKLEYTYFAPRTSKNKLLNIVLMTWPKKGIMWAILSIPIEYRKQAEKLAEECGLRIANGTPHIFDSDGAHAFPLDGKTVFTLENIKNHQVYTNNPEAQKKLRDEEFAAVDAILKADREKMIAELEEKGYSESQILRIISNWESGKEEYNESPDSIKDGQHRHKMPGKFD